MNSLPFAGRCRKQICVVVFVVITVFLIMFVTIACVRPQYMLCHCTALLTPCLRSSVVPITGFPSCLVYHCSHACQASDFGERRLSMRIRKVQFVCCSSGSQSCVLVPVCIGSYVSSRLFGSCCDTWSAWIVTMHVLTSVLVFWDLYVIPEFFCISIIVKVN